MCLFYFLGCDLFPSLFYVVERVVHVCVVVIVCSQNFHSLFPECFAASVYSTLLTAVTVVSIFVVFFTAFQQYLTDPFSLLPLSLIIIIIISIGLQDMQGVPMIILIQPKFVIFDV